MIASIAAYSVGVLARLGGVTVWSDLLRPWLPLLVWIPLGWYGYLLLRRRPVTAPADARPRTGRILLWLLVGLLTLFAFGLRAYHIGVQPYWWDELLTVWVSEAPIPTLLRTLNAATSNATDLNPPLFYLLTHGWIRAFSPKEGDVRLLSAVIGALTVPAIYLLGRTLFSVPVGLGAAFLFAVSPLGIYYGYQARDYSLLTFLAVAAALAWYRWWTPGKGRVAAVVVLTTAVLYTHYAGIWFAGSMLAASGLLWLRTTAGAVPRLGTVMRLLRYVTAFTGIILLGLFAFRMFPSLAPTGRQFGVHAGTITLFLPFILACMLLLPLTALPRPHTPSVRLLPLIGIGLVLLICFAPWFIPTGVWKTVSDQGREKLTSELFFTHLGQLAGLYDSQNVRAYPSMLSVWIILILTGGLLAGLRQPNAAVLLTWWIVVPVIAILFTANRHVISQISRYIYFTLPAYLLLLTFAITETFRIIAAAAAGYVRNGKTSLRAFIYGTAGFLAGAAALAVIVTVFVPQHIPVVSHPDNLQEYEDMVGITGALSSIPEYCLASDNQNMLRWTVWYIRVYHHGRSLPSRCTPTAPLLYMIPADAKGQGIPAIDWQPAWQQEGIRARIPEVIVHGIVLYREPKPSPGASTDRSGLVTLKLNELTPWKHHGDSENVAWIQFPSGVKPMDKSLPGILRYPVLPVFPFTATRVTVTAQTEIAGAGSSVRITLRSADGDLGTATFRKNDSTTQTLPLAAPVRSGTPVTVEVTMTDDNSGRLYSSDVRLEQLTLQFAE